MADKEHKPLRLAQPITRRQAIKLGGIAAAGLVFAEPLINTIYPKPAFANYGVEEQPDNTLCTARPVALVMKYVGGNVITNLQPDGKGGFKASVVDAGLGTTSPVKIVATKKDGTDIFFDGIVSLNETCVIESANVPRHECHADTLVKIYTPDMVKLLQTIQFHTSCSKTLNLNDRFGSLIVAGWLDKNGGQVGIQPPLPPALGAVTLLSATVDGKNLVVQLKNNSASGVARIDEIVLTWPGINNKLKKIKNNGKEIFDTVIDKDDSPSTETTITPIISPSFKAGRFGARRFSPVPPLSELKFEFDQGGSILGDYILEIDFGTGTLETVL